MVARDDCLDAVLLEPLLSGGRVCLGPIEAKQGGA